MRALTAFPAFFLLSLLAPAAGADHIDMDEVRDVLPADGIPAIDDPRFDGGDWIEDSELVIGVERLGEAKAYPVKVLDWHEIANDEIGGIPITVSYCPLCGSAIVFRRDLPTGVTTFGVSGKLYQNDLVMYDRASRSLWPQILGVAVSGPLHGTELAVVASSLTSWGEWKQRHPDSLLLAEPANAQGVPLRDYDRYPYGEYRHDRRIGIGYERRENVYGLHPKAYVLGIRLEGPEGPEAVAYPHEALREVNATLDLVAGRHVLVVAAHGDLFAWHDADRGLRWGNGLVWDEGGNAYDPASGRVERGNAQPLAPVDAVRGFWFAWYDFHPATRVWGVLGVLQVQLAPLEAGGPEQVIVVRFSESMNASSLEGRLEVRPELEHEAVWADESTLHLVARQPLAEGTYTVIVQRGVESADGKTLGSDVAHTVALGEVGTITGLVWVTLVALGLVLAALFLVASRRREGD